MEFIKSALSRLRNRSSANTNCRRLIPAAILASALIWAAMSGFEYPLVANLRHVEIKKLLICGEEPELERFLAWSSETTNSRFVALAGLASKEPAIRVQSQGLLKRILETGSPSEQQQMALSLERFIERWARRGEHGLASRALQLFQELRLPWPEPYVRVGEFCFNSPEIGSQLGIPYVEIFRGAVEASASSPRDNAFKSIAHMRLCEHALVSDRKLGRAERHCREAIRLDQYGVYTTWHTPAAYSLLGVALARQEKYEEAEHFLRQAIQVAPNSSYEATSWYRLAQEVYEVRLQYDAARRAYERVIEVESGGWADLARAELATLPLP